jgi:hypothetical protein
MFLDIPTNNTIGWQYLPETNALAYYKNPKIKDVKSFITLGPGIMFGSKTVAYPQMLHSG